MNCIVRRYDYDSYKPLKPVMHKPCEGCEGGGGEKTKYLFACVGNTAQLHNNINMMPFFNAQPYRHINMYVWLRYIHSPCSHHKACNWQNCCQLSCFCAAEKTSSTATSALRLDNNAICECS